MAVCVEKEIGDCTFMNEKEDVLIAFQKIANDPRHEILDGPRSEQQQTCNVFF